MMRLTAGFLGICEPLRAYFSRLLIDILPVRFPDLVFCIRNQFEELDVLCSVVNFIQHGQGAVLAAKH